MTGNQLIGELADKLLALVEDKDLAVSKAASQALLLIATQQCGMSILKNSLRAAFHIPVQASFLLIGHSPQCWTEK